MTTTEKERDLQEIGKSAYESIAEMVAALEVDYDRLAELKAEREALDVERRTTETGTREGDAAELALQEWDMDYKEELDQLTAEAGESESREDAEQRIQEDPLSIEVRSGWTGLGEPLEADEFSILLSTGGPAVRIVGELDQYKQPGSATLQAQDWFTPWTEYRGGDESVLLTYCQQFYFGE